MRATRFLQQVSGAISQAEASKLVSDAAKRASSTTPRKKKGIRRYSDIIVLGLTSVVAATALNRKRQYQEYQELTEAKLDRLRVEKDTALNNLHTVKECLSAEAGEGLRIALRAREGRVERLQEWIDQCFERVVSKPEIAEGGGKPKVI